jgi:hypothetical protein
MEVGLRRLVRALGAVLTAALVSLMVLLGLYLAADDDTFWDGASRWSHRIGEPDNKALFWTAVALTLVAVLALSQGVRSGRVRDALGGVVAGTLALGAIVFTFVAFTAS